MPQSKSIDEQAAFWVARMNAAPDAAAHVAFRAWHDADSRHAGAYLRAEAAWTLLDRAQVLAHGEGALDREGVIGQHRARRTRRFVIGGAAAAAATGVATVAVTLKPELSLATATGETRSVPLQDHSTAAVNTDSRIDVAMSDQIRHVKLVKGEAWFQVSKNAEVPFVVSAGDIRVRAVGTAFSVRRRNDGAEVLVTEGVVEVWHVGNTSNRLTLSAGGGAFVPETSDSAGETYPPEEIERRLAWRARQIILDGTTLAEAVAEFNRYNQRKIVIADPVLAGEQLAGGFQVDQPDTFARAVHLALGVPVAIDDSRIIIGTVSKPS